MASQRQKKFNSLEEYLTHFATIKRQHAPQRGLFSLPSVQAAPQSDVSSTDSTVPVAPTSNIQSIEVDDSAASIITLTITFSDGSTKVVPIKDLSDRVDAIETAVNNQADALSSLVTSQVETATQVLSQLTDVNSRVAKIEQVV